MPVLQHRHLEHDLPVPVFGESKRWDLRSLGWNPAAGRHSAVRLLFDRFDTEWNLRARELAIAQLNPVHSIVRRQRIHLSAQPVHVKTIRAKLDGLSNLLPGTPRTSARSRYESFARPTLTVS